MGNWAGLAAGYLSQHTNPLHSVPNKWSSEPAQASVPGVGPSGDSTSDTLGEAGTASRSPQVSSHTVAVTGIKLLRYDIPSRTLGKFPSLPMPG